MNKVGRPHTAPNKDFVGFAWIWEFEPQETVMGRIGLNLIGIVVIIFALLPGDVTAQPLVRVGYSGIGVAKNLHKTIERAGLWKKRGLDVRLIYFTSGATMAQAMVGGDIDIADSDVPAMLNAVSVGILDAN